MEPGISGGVFQVIDNGQVKPTAFELCHYPKGFFLGFLGGDGLREEINADIQPGLGGAGIVGFKIAVFVEAALLAVILPADAEEGKGDIVGGNLLPVDRALIAGNIDAGAAL